MRHVVPQAVELAHVAGAGLVVDDAGGHEQRGLEGRMIDDVEHTGDRAQRRAHAEQQRDQTEMADGGIGKQALEVVLEQGGVSAEQQCDQTDAGDHVEPQFRTGQRREQPRQQEHAGLDHGGGVQIRADRRRCRHGVRQPEMERELRRLGEGAEQDQPQRQWIQCMRLDLLARGQHHREFVAAGDVAEQQDAGEHGQTAAAGDGQRHARAAPRVGAVLPVADQQERTQTGEFPEHEQQQQVFGQHDAEHRGHEQQQQTVEAPHRIVFRQVVARIQDDQQADAQDQQREQQRQSIQPQREVQTQRG